MPIKYAKQPLDKKLLAECSAILADRALSECRSIMLRLTRLKKLAEYAIRNQPDG
jgi:hypothetical protein